MTRPRLLIAEDDEALAALLEEYLSEANYEVVVCNRGDDALNLIKREHFDLILSDIVMPGGDGLMLLEEARHDPAVTLVVLMTGYSGIEDAIHAVEQGAYDFVSKPFQLPEIRVRLDNASRYQSLLRLWKARDKDSFEDWTHDHFQPLGKGVETTVQAGQAAIRAYGIVRE